MIAQQFLFPALFYYLVAVKQLINKALILITLLLVLPGISSKAHVACKVITASAQQNDNSSLSSSAIDQPEAIRCEQISYTSNYFSRLPSWDARNNTTLPGASGLLLVRSGGRRLVSASLLFTCAALPLYLFHRVLLV